MRTFERTHPWIRFEPLNLAGGSAATWMMLGEAQSKCDHLAGVPLQPEVARRLHQAYLAKGAAATTAIEGNTLSEEAVRRLVEEADLRTATAYQEREVANVLGAFNEIGQQLVAGQELRVTPSRIRALNEKVLAGLELPTEVVPGEVRSHSVGVLGYRGAPAEDCEFLLEALCAWLNGIPGALVPGAEVATAIVKAVLAHVYLAWIHPFGDGNGRTARLVEFQILVSAGVPTPAAHLLSNHYNETRPEYYRQLERSSRSGGDLSPFLHYAATGFVAQLRRQIEEVRRQVWQVSWRDFVYDRFRGRESEAGRRQRQLVLDLSWRDPVVVSGITNLTPSLAALYVGRTRRMITRDLNDLLEAGMIEQAGVGYRARVEQILSFLPYRRPSIDAPPLVR
jgi:Fic family protein